MNTELQKKFEQWYLSERPLNTQFDLMIMPASESGLDIVYLEDDIQILWVGFQAGYEMREVEK